MIVVFGSLNVDLVLTAAEHPRPGETVLCETSSLSPGGKGNNQAVAASRGGAEVAMVGRIGADAFGTLLLESLQANRVNADSVRRDPTRMTGCAAVAVDGHGENIIYVAAGANGAARADDVTDELLARASTVVCQMEVTPSENWQLLERAKRAGTRTILNVAPARDLDAAAIDAVTRWVDVLLVNGEEARQLARHLRLADAVADPDQMASNLAKRLGALCVLTLGAEGACASNGTERWAVPSTPVAVKDTTGAGDTFTGVLAAMLDEGRSVADSLKLASVAASLTCREVGAQNGMPYRPEVERYAQAR
ncbi:MAG TPA: ribokinase [Xanthobacteraceae bacterium]